VAVTGIELLAMSEPTNYSPGSEGSTGSRDPQFREHPRTTRWPPGLVAAVAVAAVVVLGTLLVLEMHHPAPTGSAAYAEHLQLSNVRVSQSESLSGARSTFVDGQVVNNGDQTVTAATVEAQFAWSGGQTQTATAPLAIVHMRQPVVDTVPLSTAPLGPGQQADFRLIFDSVKSGFNMRVTNVRVLEASTR
jgi:hypothetical protein